MVTRKTRKKIGIVLVVIGMVLILVFIALMASSCALSGKMNVTANPNSKEQVSEENPVDWEYWKSVNPAVVGWVKVPGTGVDLPVVEAPEDDPQYYLSHDVYGEWNYYGCPYIDAGCKNGLMSPNVVIYGHNMAVGNPMFAELENYHSQEYAEEHREIVLYTPERVMHLKVIGSRTIGGWEDLKRTEFKRLADFKAYREEMLSACGVVLDWNDKAVEAETGSLKDVYVVGEDSNVEAKAYLSEAGSEEDAFNGEAIASNAAAKSKESDVPQLYTFCTCSYYYNPANERTLVFASMSGI